MWVTVLPHPTLCPQGERFELARGDNLCQGLLDQDIAIEHACEMSCACTTCHVLVRQGGASLEVADELEEDQLDKAWGLESTSRLSCQVVVTDTDLVIELPLYTINQNQSRHT